MKYQFYFRTKERNKCIFQILLFDNNSDNVKKKETLNKLIFSKFTLTFVHTDTIDLILLQVKIKQTAVNIDIRGYLES